MTKVVGLMIARDEELCAGMTVESAAPVIDELVFVDNASKDKTVQVVQQKCKELNIPCFTYHEDLNNTVARLRQKCLDYGRLRHPTHFFTCDGDMVFTNTKEIRDLAEKGQYDAYWFRTLNLYGDMKSKRIGGMNIPHVWLFRNKNGISGGANYQFLPQTHKSDPNKERFIGWNLNGIKWFDHIFWRFQIWYMRAWNAGHGTNLGVDEWTRLYFNKEPSDKYKKTYVLNRMRGQCLEVKATAAVFKCTEAEFIKKYMNYPPLLGDWNCPFELIFDEEGKVCGRKPDLVDIPVLDNEHIWSLKKNVMDAFRKRKW